MFAIVNAGEVVEYPIYDLRIRFPNISFPDLITDIALPEGVVRVHPAAPPAHNPDREMLEEGTPVLVGDRWESTYIVVPLDEAEVARNIEVYSAAVRDQRDRLLQQSDWTQVMDAPVDRTAWAEYRQALRDIPAQPGFPFNVTWPVAP